MGTIRASDITKVMATALFVVGVWLATAAAASAAAAHASGALPGPASGLFALYQRLFG